MAEHHKYISEIQQHKSAEAYYGLVKLYEKRIFSLCYKIIGNREEAEEAAQDVFMNCFKNIHKLETPEKFTPWILRIAYHKSIDYVRRKKMKTEEWGENSVQQKRETTSEIYDEGDFSKYLSPLSEKEKVVIQLYYQERIPTKEIAEMMNLGKNNVKILLFRGRKKIKTYLENQKRIKT